MGSYIKWVLIIFVLVGVFFFENVWGYIHFKRLCSEHKELIVYNKLEQGVGWQYDTSMPHSEAAVDDVLYFMPQISFFRYQDLKTRLINDVRFIGEERVTYEDFDWNSERHRNEVNSRVSPENFASEEVGSSKANSSKVPIYQLEIFRENVGKRISISGLRIKDLRNDIRAVQLGSIGYSFFDKSRTLFTAPSGILCRPAPSLYSSLIKEQIFEK